MEDSGQKKKRAYSVSSLTSPSSSGRNNNGETGTSLSVAISSTDVAKHTAKRQATDPNGDQKQHASQNSQERSVSSPTVKSNGPVTLRLLVATKHAGSLIGRGGCMVAEIRDGAGVRATVSENIAGAPDRIFTAVGGPSQLANAFGRVARVLAGAEVDEGSGPKTDPETRQLTFRLLMPNEMMGSVIGKQAAKIKEIQKTTGARLSAMEGLLPDSTERKLSVIGIAESLEGAIKEVCILLFVRRHKLNRPSDRTNNARVP